MSNYLRGALYIETEESNNKIFLGVGYNGGLGALLPAVFGCFSKKIGLFGSDGMFQRLGFFWGWVEGQAERQQGGACSPWLLAHEAIPEPNGDST